MGEASKVRREPKGDWLNAALLQEVKNVNIGRFRSLQEELSIAEFLRGLVDRDPDPAWVAWAKAQLPEQIQLIAQMRRKIGPQFMEYMGGSAYVSNGYVMIRKHNGKRFPMSVDEAIRLGEMAKAYVASKDKEGRKDG